MGGRGHGAVGTEAGARSGGCGAGQTPCSSRAAPAACGRGRVARREPGAGRRRAAREGAALGGVDVLRHGQRVGRRGQAGETQQQHTGRRAHAAAARPGSCEARGQRAGGGGGRRAGQKAAGRRHRGGRSVARTRAVSGPRPHAQPGGSGERRQPQAAPAAGPEIAAGEGASGSSGHRASGWLLVRPGGPPNHSAPHEQGAQLQAEASAVARPDALTERRRSNRVVGCWLRAVGWF